MLPIFLAWLARSRHLGDQDDAEAALARATGATTPAVCRGGCHYPTCCCRSLGIRRRWQHTAARAQAMNAAIRSLDGWVGTELTSLHDATRLGEPNLQVRLTQLSAKTDHLLAPYYAAHATALACE